MRKLTSNVNILAALLLSCLVSRIILAEPLVSQEVLNKIKKECAAVYPHEALVEFVMEQDIDTEKGGFVPSPLEAINKCLSVFLEPGMKFIDLGSGDGRVVFLASLYGVEATGIEYDSTLYQISVEASKNLSDIINTKKVHFIKGDFLQHDFSDYDIFYIYEGTDDILSLEEKLSKEMKPGSLLIVFLGDPVSVDNTVLIRKLNALEIDDEEHIKVFRKIR